MLGSMSGWTATEAHRVALIDDPTIWLRGMHPVPNDEIGAAWHRIAARSPAVDAVARVHAPPCAFVCPIGGTQRRSGSSCCAERLLEEIEADAEAPYLRGRRIRALTLSGGIPVLFSADDLHRLLKTLVRVLSLDEDCEVTVEDPAGALVDGKADACREAGANRFFVDVRSFDTALRRKAGLPGAAETMIVHLSGLADLPGTVVACSLVHGFPDQSAERGRRDVQMVLDLGLDGIELRRFRPDAGVDALDLEECARLYADVAHMLDAAGWRQIANHQWGGPRERNLFPRLIEGGAECLAFGPGASGMMEGHCFRLEEDLDRYAAGVRSGAKPVAEMAVLPPMSRTAGLIRAGFAAGWFERAALDPLLDAAARVRVDDMLRRWQRTGHVRILGPVVELTTVGRFLAPTLVAALMTAASGDARSASHRTHCK